MKKRSSIYVYMALSVILCLICGGSGCGRGEQTMVTEPSIEGNYVGYFSTEGGQHIHISRMSISKSIFNTYIAHPSKYYGLIELGEYTGLRDGNHIVFKNGARQFEGDIVDGIFTGTYSLYGTAEGTGIPNSPFTPGPFNYNRVADFKGNPFAAVYRMYLENDPVGYIIGVRINPDGTILTGPITLAPSTLGGSGTCSESGAFTFVANEITCTGTLTIQNNTITGIGNYTTTDGASGTFTISREN